MTARFPLPALVGQAALVEALLVNAVAPEVGGVLVRGERGTAKSTAVRALAPLLPEVTAAVGERFAFAPGEEAPGGPVPANAPTEARPARLVELPVGATADRLVGSLDLGRALSDGVRAFEPGLLAAAHRGILYVDEVNLLPDHLVDLLLDAAALGVCHVERDGVSVRHAARFMLVGTMNPEEGDLRPQLLDRFGLSVEVRAPTDPAQRAEVVRRRLAYEADPERFAAGYADGERAVAARIAAARERLPRVRLGEAQLLRIVGACARLGVDGLRADIVTAKAARALAALAGAEQVDEEHVRRAAMLALAHRRRRGPLEQPGLDERELDEALDPEPDGPDGGGSGGGGGGRSGGPASNGSARGEREGAAAGASAGTGPAPERTDPPSGAGEPPPLALGLAGAGAGPGGRRARSAGRDGQPIDSRPANGVPADVAVLATLRAAATARPGEPPRARGDELREHVRAGREACLLVLVVDASGSMGARRRMARVKEAALGLLLDAYQRRDRVAVIAFRDSGAELLVPPGAGVERAAAALRALPTGGRTPLAAGLDAAAGVIRRERLRDPGRRSLAVIVTDGRVSDGRDGLARACASATRLGALADGCWVFDSEEGPARLRLAARLAGAAGARLEPLASLLSDGSQRRRAA